MKKILKKITPNWILNWKRKQNLKKSVFNNLETSEVFTKIYSENHWGSAESISGPGSEIEQTKTLIGDLNKLFIDKNITSVLDIPCGDFNWMQHVNLNNIDYVGADIVDQIIQNNISQFKETDNRKFKVLNLITDNLPNKDIIVVRDCLVHLSYKDVDMAIKNIKKSGAKYLLTTTFSNQPENIDIVTGDWRRINLQAKPFNFPEPILVINENCSESNGKHTDKSMALWEISKL